MNVDGLDELKPTDTAHHRQAAQIQRRYAAYHKERHVAGLDVGAAACLHTQTTRWRKRPR